MDDIITTEEYFREHARRLRTYARYTSAKASERLIESAQFLELQADRARDRDIAKSKKEPVPADARKMVSALPRLRRVR